ncbi:MAG TPA: hypothetical protein PK362_09160, partial [Elusimicrobiota bacterium]|nr:hypothetical protein [Elusimicrobiota bacterium]
SSERRDKIDAVLHMDRRTDTHDFVSGTVYIRGEQIAFQGGKLEVVNAKAGSTIMGYTTLTDVASFTLSAKGEIGGLGIGERVEHASGLVFGGVEAASRTTARAASAAADKAEVRVDANGNISLTAPTVQITATRVVTVPVAVADRLLPAGESGEIVGMMNSDKGFAYRTAGNMWFVMSEGKLQAGSGTLTTTSEVANLAGGKVTITNRVVLTSDGHQKATEMLINGSSVKGGYTLANGNTAYLLSNGKLFEVAYDKGVAVTARSVNTTERLALPDFRDGTTTLSRSLGYDEKTNRWQANFTSLTTVVGGRTKTMDIVGAFSDPKSQATLLLVADRSNGQRGREYLFALKQDSEGAITGVTAFGNKSIDFAPEKGKPLGQYLKTNAQGQITERGTTIMIDGKLVRNNSVMDMSNARQQLGLLQDMKGYFAVQNGRLITWDEGKKQWVRVNGGVQEFSNQKMYIVTAKDGAAPTAAGLQARQFNATAVGVILSLRVQDGKLQFDNRIDPKTADASKMFWEARRLDGDGAALSFKDISSAAFKSAVAWVGT